MKKFRNGILKLIILLLIIAGMGYVAKQAAPLIKLGLDLNGGVSITYQAVEDNPTAENMSDAVYKLQLKAQDYSTEAEVYQEGSNKINIDIPGAKDATKILEELGEPGNLYFVEGELTWPEIISSPSEASPSEAEEISDEDRYGVGPGTVTSTVSNATSSQTDINDLLSNVNVDGANIWRGPNGEMTIGGESPGEGWTLVQNPNQPQYDYTQKPIYATSSIVISGIDVTSAKGGMYQDNRGQTSYAVDLTFSEEGAVKFAEATKRNLGQIIYILYNDKLVSAPTVQSEITEGRAQITGMSSLEEAERIASTIRIGALPIELKEIRSNVVGAKLGEEAINTSLKAGLIGFIIVCIFMICVYFLPGLAASLALTLYITMMFFLLQSFEVTLTLPGIAGIILSVGMAVDANVIIFTRIKEEIGAGKNTVKAVNEGFNKALSAILDGNITTLIAAAVLFIKGTGSIKGFAITLALGIVLSLVTALFITKFIINAFIQIGLVDPKLYGKKVDRKPIPFVDNVKICYAIAIVIIVSGISAIVINQSKGNGGFNYGIDFAGGASTTITFTEDLNNQQVAQDIVPVFEGVIKDAVQTQTVKGTNQVIVKSRDLTLEEREEIYELLASPSIAKHELDPEVEITTENISGAVSDQMKQDATIAVIIATILMLIYIWFRFKDVRFAGSAVIALIHDCLVTIGFYAIFRWTVDSTFIACMLTIVGYSINATIVIFDRIRENLSRMRGKPVKEIVNVSITQTFTRSINTSFTTFIMVVMLYVMGVTSIKQFALPLMIGILAGTFSSIFITGALWYDLKKGSIDEHIYDQKINKKEDVDVIKESIRQDKKRKK